MEYYGGNLTWLDHYGIGFPDLDCSIIFRIVHTCANPSFFRIVDE